MNIYGAFRSNVEGPLCSLLDTYYPADSREGEYYTDSSGQYLSIALVHTAEIQL